MPVFEFRIRIECDVPIAPVFSHANVLQRIRESLAQSLGGLWPTIAVQSLEIDEQCAFVYDDGDPCLHKRADHYMVNHAFIAPQ